MEPARHAAVLQSAARHGRVRGDSLVQPEGVSSSFLDVLLIFREANLTGRTPLFPLTALLFLKVSRSPWRPIPTPLSNY
jgi:hypothetical protein